MANWTSVYGIHLHETKNKILTVFIHSDLLLENLRKSEVILYIDNG
jgi:hypothetical protein